MELQALKARHRVFFQISQNAWYSLVRSISLRSQRVARRNPLSSVKKASRPQVKQAAQSPG